LELFLSCESDTPVIFILTFKTGLAEGGTGVGPGVGALVVGPDVVVVVPGVAVVGTGTTSMPTVVLAALNKVF